VFLTAPLKSSKLECLVSSQLLMCAIIQLCGRWCWVCRQICSICRRSRRWEYSSWYCRYCCCYSVCITLGKFVQEHLLTYLLVKQFMIPWRRLRRGASVSSPAFWNHNLIILVKWFGWQYSKCPHWGTQRWLRDISALRQCRSEWSVWFRRG